VWDWLRAILGDVTAGEAGLVAVLFTLIMLFSWAPRIGQTVGGWFDGEED
jgi:hypothetical protein